MHWHYRPIKIHLFTNPPLTTTEKYTEEQHAVAHVRRLLDIVACTTRYDKPKNGKPNSPTAHAVGSGKARTRDPVPNADPPPENGEPTAAAAAIESLDMAAIHPIPKLSDFYDFFAFSHLSPPIISEFVSLLSCLFIKVSIFIVKF